MYIKKQSIRSLDADVGLRLIREHFELLRRFYSHGGFGSLSHERVIQYFTERGIEPDHALGQLFNHDILDPNENQTTWYLGEIAQLIVSFYLNRALEASGDILVSYIKALRGIIEQIEATRYDARVDEPISEARNIINRVNSFVRGNRDRALREVEDAKADKSATQYRLKRLLTCLDSYISPIGKIFEIGGEVNRNIEELQALLRTIERQSAFDLDLRIRDDLHRWREEQLRCSIALQEAANNIHRILNNRYALVLGAETRVEAKDRARFEAHFDGLLPLCGVRNEPTFSDDLIQNALADFFVASSLIDDGYELDHEPLEFSVSELPLWIEYADLFASTQGRRGTNDLLRWVKEHTDLAGHSAINLILNATTTLSEPDSAWQLDIAPETASLEFDDLIVEAYQPIKVTYAHQ